MAKEDLLSDTSRKEETRKVAKSWQSQGTDFLRSRNTKEIMAEDSHLWRLGTDGRLFDVIIIIIIIGRRRRIRIRIIITIIIIITTLNV